ncbi:AraC family transcriptional regulator [Lacrimispora amygdalina]|uniref:AraC family transcriptional regulator n=1 Tax=Lacrimispora amygdalina TaxID=253257 RepID=A0A3E2N5L8_9FIRM|nr:AraC family transcriptional regulator [Clostridium indicum]
MPDFAYEGCSVKAASLSVGYRNEGHFIDLFRRYYNFTPGELLRTKNVKKL